MAFCALTWLAGGRPSFVALFCRLISCVPLCCQLYVASALASIALSHLCSLLSLCHLVVLHRCRPSCALSWLTGGRLTFAALLVCSFPLPCALVGVAAWPSLQLTCDAWRCLTVAVAGRWSPGLVILAHRHLITLLRTLCFNSQLTLLAHLVRSLPVLLSSSLACDRAFCCVPNVFLGSWSA